jgi:hypothetical protein
MSQGIFDRSRCGSDSRTAESPDRPAGVEPSSRGLALVNLTVQRASRSFWRSLAGLSFQSSGMRPSLMAFFSSSLLRWRGAAICPDMAIKPACLEVASNIEPLK